MAQLGTAELTIGWVRDTFNTVRGGVFTILETLGLQENQERAAKGLARKVTYDAQTELEAMIRGQADE